MNDQTTSLEPTPSPVMEAPSAATVPPTETKVSSSASGSASGSVTPVVESSVPQVTEPSHVAAIAPAQQVPPQHSMTTRSKNNISKPVTRYNLAASLQTDPHWTPSTYQQAMQVEHWRDAMSSEFNSTNSNHT